MFGKAVQGQAQLTLWKVATGKDKLRNAELSLIAIQLYLVSERVAPCNTKPVVVRNREVPHSICMESVNYTWHRIQFISRKKLTLHLLV